MVLKLILHHMSYMLEADSISIRQLLAINTEIELIIVLYILLGFFMSWNTSNGYK